MSREAQQPHALNHLAGQTSPYLLQHVNNPVDWYPWGDEALEKSLRENKPILLSIGYSACHWCHVMAHESFEDPAIAQVMNELYINIKVDREERPDLDKIYQLAHHLLTQRSGGWPLTMFLMPNQTPFFGGTYFPNKARYGMPSFVDVMRQIHAAYLNHGDAIKEQNQHLMEALASTNVTAVLGHQINYQPLDVARKQLESSFDFELAGFGKAPKFPHPTHIERLMRHWATTSAANAADVRALDMAVLTLTKMAQGGIYDQLGGGFCRYSVDDHWMIPHFEKMLYDNGPLLAIYTDAWRATQNPLYRRISVETAEWVMREMQSPEGGYYSTLDADSEGHEGKFYVWQKEEIERLLTREEYRVVEKHFGLDQPPNFEQNAWHLHVFVPVAELSEALSQSDIEIENLLVSAKAKLFYARETRIRPGRDEKILTAWNGLMIKGMAVAGLYLNEQRFIDSADQALEFVKTVLWQNGRLLATYKDGKARVAAYLDDYVFLIDAIVTLLQARFRDQDLVFACELADVVLTHFEDQELGGFYFTADDHERLIFRPKPLTDDALPAGNGIAAHVLGRLGHLTNEIRYLDAAERTLKAAWPALMEVPYAHNALLLALEEYLDPPEVIFLRGEGELLKHWQTSCTQQYMPRRLVFAIESGGEKLPGGEINATPGTVVAYRCSGTSCSPPISDLAELRC